MRHRFEHDADSADDRSARLALESFLRLVGLDWAVPDFGTPSRRRKTLAVTIPYRGSEERQNLLTDNEP